MFRNSDHKLKLLGRPVEYDSRYHRRIIYRH